MNAPSVTPSLLLLLLLDDEAASSSEVLQLPLLLLALSALEPSEEEEGERHPGCSSRCMMGAATMKPSGNSSLSHTATNRSSPHVSPCFRTK